MVADDLSGRDYVLTLYNYHYIFGPIPVWLGYNKGMGIGFVFSLKKTEDLIRADFEQ